LAKFYVQYNLVYISVTHKKVLHFFPGTTDIQATVRWYMNEFPGFIFNVIHIPCSYLASSPVLTLSPMDRTPWQAQAADNDPP
jgi:hypothetical protein